MKAIWLSAAILFSVFAIFWAALESAQGQDSAARSSLRECLKKLAEGESPYEVALTLSKSDLNEQARVSASVRTARAMMLDNGDEWTALTAALAVEEDVLAVMLVGKEADVNVSTKMGYAPLWFVASRHQECSTNLEIAKLLLAAGADTEASPKRVIDGPSGRTPLHVAASKLNAELVKLLVEYGADINAKDSNGDTVSGKLGMFIDQDERRTANEIRVILESGTARN